MAGVEIRRPLIAFAVHLRFEIVEQDDVVAGVAEGVGQVRADETRPTGDQDAFAQDVASFPVLARKRSSSSSGTRYPSLVPPGR